jgi:nucleotide-binding universal stress UspA family protein
MKTILVPVDFSPVTDAVVATATDLARELAAKVVLLSVIQPPVVMSEYTPILENIAEITAAGEKNAERELAKLEKKLTDEFISAESVVVVGSPGPAILEQAREAAADFIVLGSHGHTAFYDLLVGSTAHMVLLKANCPVVIVPAAKKPAAAKTRVKAAVR